MVGVEIIGIGLVAASIVYSFYKKNDNLGFALMLILLVLLYLLYGTR